MAVNGLLAGLLPKSWLAKLQWLIEPWYRLPEELTRGFGEFLAGVTPVATPFLIGAIGLVRPPSMAGARPGAHAPGEPNAVYGRCTRSGAVLPTAWPQPWMQSVAYLRTHPFLTPIE